MWASPRSGRSSGDYRANFLVLVYYSPTFAVYARHQRPSRVGVLCLSMQKCMKVGLVPNSRSSVDSLASGGTASPQHIWCHCYRGHNPPIKKTSNVLTSQSALAWLGGKTMFGRYGVEPSLNHDLGGPRRPVCLGTETIQCYTSV